MAHYDARGEVAPHVRRQVEALARSVDKLTVVTTAELTGESRTWLQKHAQLLERPNYGYDFFSYKIGLDANDLSAFGEVTVCNDSYVGPLVPYEDIYSRMASRKVDFWGFTESHRFAPHIQSFFVTFRPWVVDSKAFRRFWTTMVPLSDRWEVIQAYELGLSRVLRDAGFVAGAYFEESPSDVRLARRRARWWVSRQSPLPRSTAAIGLLRSRASVPWNPSAAFADKALENARLPFVKIDTLRYDPYGLDADRLLTLCERAYPHHFDGVRRWLEDTNGRAPVRWAEKLQPTRTLKMLRPLVRYGRTRA